MDIKRVATDTVNETIVMTVVHMDYKGQVAKRINEKMPLATVKGFRKGQVPKSIVEKHYGKSIKQEEIKKVVDLALERYILSERLHIFGTPILKVNENLNWDDEELTFEFEIGLVPNFEIDLEAKNNIVKYVINFDDDKVKNQIERIQEQFGNKIPQEQVTEKSKLTGIFTNEVERIDSESTFSLSSLKNKEAIDQFIGKKAGDVVTINTKDLFEDDHQLMDYLKIEHDKVHNLVVDVDFLIKEISTTEPAELNQELFDKLFGPGNIATLEELKAKIKQDANIRFEQQAEEKLLHDVANFLIENTKIELPTEFLKKWLQTKSSKKLSSEEAELEYNKSEKSLRFELIKEKALTQNNIKITFDDLKSFATKTIHKQMAQYGIINPSEKEVQDIVAKVLSNQEEVKKLHNEAIVDKLLELFKEKAKPTLKEVTYKEFIAAYYEE